MTAVAQIRALLRRHLDSLPEEIAAIEAVMNQGGPEARAAAVKRLHVLAGSSGTLGFREIGAAAARLERRLETDGDPGDAAHAALATLKALARVARPEHSPLFNVRLGA